MNTSNKLTTLTLMALMPLTVIGQAKPTVKPEHNFFDKYNVVLFSADALVRSLDAKTTRDFMTNPCKCMKENNLPDAIVSSTPRMYAYSLGVSAGIIGLSYLAHRTHHHRIERLIPLLDATYDGREVINNIQHINQTDKLYSNKPLTPNPTTVQLYK